VNKKSGFQYLLLNTDWGTICSINIGISKKKLEIIETNQVDLEMESLQQHQSSTLSILIIISF